ncbi:hypothetical protein ViNHUV68_23980 [Vibrio sp. NH-UV-68]
MAPFFIAMNKKRRQQGRRFVVDGKGLTFTTFYRVNDLSG